MSAKKPIKSSAKQITSKPPAKPAAQKSAPRRATTRRTLKPTLSTPTKTPKQIPTPAQAPIPLLRPGSKQAHLLNLLQTDGATITQMMKLTGWQAHTLRATLSAVFRKRLGLTIETDPVLGTSARMFRIAPASA